MFVLNVQKDMLEIIVRGEFLINTTSLTSENVIFAPWLGNVNELVCLSAVPMDIMAFQPNHPQSVRNVHAMGGPVILSLENV